MLLEIKTGVRTNPSGRGQIPRIMLLKCDVCSTQYERPYSKHHFEETLHRCSRKCVYGSRSTDGAGGNGAEIIQRQCGHCNKDLRLMTKGSTYSTLSFCNKKCYGLWRSAHPETYAENTAKMHTEESARKISLRVQERMSQPDYIHPRLGTHHTEETKQFISKHHKESGCLNGPKNGMYGKHHTDEARDKMSDTRTRLMIEGKIQFYPKHTRSGNYVSSKTGVSSHYKSGWELAYMKWLDTNVDVLAWEFESTRIPYHYNDHKRWYVPDFIVTYVDGTKIMYEIKPKEFIDTEKNKLKESAGKSYCLANEIHEYQILTGDSLRAMKAI